jgi:hypothetical protein
MTAKKENTRTYTKYTKFTEEVAETFRKKIQAKSTVNTNGCWIWNGQISNNRYGKVSVKGLSITAHRASYIAFNGEIHDDKFICHSCDVRNCANPEHLFAGTHAENMKDAYNKGIIKLCFTDDQVNAIKSLQQQGIPNAELARKFNVDHETIRNVIRNKTYKHVNPENIRWAEPKPFSIEFGPIEPQISI